MAAAFQLVEILGCLKSARSLEVPERLSEVWKQHLADTGKKVTRLLRQIVSKDAESFSRNKAFRRYEKSVLRMRPRLER
jgi:hypothetical protein